MRKNLLGIGARLLELIMRPMTSIGKTLQHNLLNLWIQDTLKPPNSKILISPISDSPMNVKDKKKKTSQKQRKLWLSKKKMNLVDFMDMLLLMVCCELLRNCLKSEWLPNWTTYSLQRKRKTSKGWFSETKDSTWIANDKFGLRCSYSKMSCSWS